MSLSLNAPVIIWNAFPTEICNTDLYGMSVNSFHLRQLKTFYLHTLYLRDHAGTLARQLHQMSELN